MLLPEFESSHAAVPFRVRLACVVCQVLDGPGHVGVEASWSVHQGVQDIAKDVVDALGDDLRGHCDVRQTLCHVGTLAFEGRGTQRRPDKSFGDVGVGSVEGVEVRMGFPLLEQQFHLPA